MRTSIPRFLKDRPTTAATSVSQPVRIAGSASSTVTATPMSDEHRRELTADRPAADHRGALRQRREVEELVGGDDDAAVDLEAGQGARHRPRGEHHEAPGQARAPASGPSTTRTTPSASRRPVPLATVTPRPLSSPDRPLKSRSTTSFLRDWLTEKSTTGSPTARPNSPACGDRAAHVGRLEELLRRDAAAVQAGPADLVALDQRDAQAGRRAVEGGGVAPGATPTMTTSNCWAASATVGPFSVSGVRATES